MLFATDFLISKLPSSNTLCTKQKLILILLLKNYTVFTDSFHWNEIENLLKTTSKIKKMTSLRAYTKSSALSRKKAEHVFKIHIFSLLSHFFSLSFSLSLFLADRVTSIRYLQIYDSTGNFIIVLP